MVLLGLLLWCTGAIALSASDYQVKVGILSGGEYVLVGTSENAGPRLAGGAYQLLMPSALHLTGSGCCCTYLPCTFDNW
jgi:hypothetical protein